jgi:hypothetical protein
MRKDSWNLSEEITQNRKRPISEWNEILVEQEGVIISSSADGSELEIELHHNGNTALGVVKEKGSLQDSLDEINEEIARCEKLKDYLTNQVKLYDKAQE